MAGKGCVGSRDEVGKSCGGKGDVNELWSDLAEFRMTDDIASETPWFYRYSI